MPLRTTRHRKVAIGPTDRSATLSQRVLLCEHSRFSDLLLRMVQHRRRVHILPPALAYVDSPDLIVVGHQSNSVSQATIIPTALRFCSFEIVENFQRTNEQAGINGVELAQMFPNIS